MGDVSVRERGIWGGGGVRMSYALDVICRFVCLLMSLSSAHVVAADSVFIAVVAFYVRCFCLARMRQSLAVTPQLSVADVITTCVLSHHVIW